MLFRSGRRARSAPFNEFVDAAIKSTVVKWPWNDQPVNQFTGELEASTRCSITRGSLCRVSRGLEDGAAGDGIEAEDESLGVRPGEIAESLVTHGTVRPGEHCGRARGQERADSLEPPG